MFRDTATPVGAGLPAMGRIEPGIPCHYAREQASELMGYVRDMTLTGVMEDKPQLVWAS
ncbi:DUF3077 domain-containing protein [Pseudomonas sp. NY15356]|uniref:DUF3077 domain-containing protein n=1 Tax=Pseudomonas TaxID=286 RepID=UPI003A88BDDA